VVWTEHRQDGGNVFLVPDEGNSAILQLHDLLYGGPLAHELRLDIPFVPHLTIGRCRSLAEAKALSDALNAEPIRIPGSIREISVVAEADGALAVLSRFPLRGS
jgi:2'-5' RNA ligase